LGAFSTQCATLRKKEEASGNTERVSYEISEQNLQKEKRREGRRR
jgi:hypothetical protein